jgi:hypothetical protein
MGFKMNRRIAIGESDVHADWKSDSKCQPVCRNVPDRLDEKPSNLKRGSQRCSGWQVYDMATFRPSGLPKRNARDDIPRHWDVSRDLFHIPNSYARCGMFFDSLIVGAESRAPSIWSVASSAASSGVLPFSRATMYAAYQSDQGRFGHPWPRWSRA